MSAFNDFFAPVVPKYSGRGGARPNTGPKPGHVRAGLSTPVEELNDYQRMERAKADKETALARQAEVKANLDEGLVVERAAVQTACAKAFAAISQMLDALPDTLERQLGLAPDVAERVGLLIAEAKSQLAEDLRKAHEVAADE